MTAVSTDDPQVSWVGFPGAELVAAVDLGLEGDLASWHIGIACQLCGNH